MPAPEINVRLTADGVQDVVNAFKRVQGEAKATTEEVGLLGEAGAQLKDLIPLVTIGAAVEQVVELGKNALESAINIGKLSEKTGASAGTLSVLAMAAHDVGVNQDELGSAMVKLAKAQELAAQGSKKQQLGFESLGISMADVKAKNPADLFVEIAQKMALMPDGATKAAASMTLMGRSGANLIPVLNEIGQGNGFEEAKQKAENLGLFLSDDMVADALKAEEAIATLEDTTKGFAMRFISGFAPQMTGSVVAFSNAINGPSTDAVKGFGNFVGNVVRGIVNIFLVAGQTIGAIFASVFDGIEQGFTTFVAVAKALDQNDLKGAWSALKSGASDMGTSQGAIWQKYGQLVKADYTDAAATGGLKTGGGGGADDASASAASKAKALKEFQKFVDAKAAYEDQIATSELANQKLRDQQSAAEDKALYDQGLLSLNAYYDARGAQINQAMDAEESTLRQKLAIQVNAAAQLLGKSGSFVENLIQQSPKAIEAAAGANAAALTMLGKIAATKAQIDGDEIKRQTELQQNELARSQAQQQAVDKEFADRQKLYTLQGMTSAAQQVALDKEMYDTDLMLQKLGVAEAERQAILSRVRANAMAKDQMSSLSQTGGDALTNLQTGVTDIQDKASAGAISEWQATAQIYTLEKERLPNLQQIVTQMNAIVDAAEAQLLALQPGSDDYNAQLQVVDQLQQAADKYTQQVNKLAEGLNTTKGFAVELQNQLASQGGTALTTFFDNIGTGTKDAQTAFADLGRSFETMIVHMIDQMIVYYTLMALVGWIAPGSSLYTSLKSSGPFTGLTGHSAGGFTGGGPTNRVSGVVHGQEFVLQAAAVRKFGIPLLAAMNAGTVGSIAGGSGGFSSMGGSAAGSGDSTPLVQVNIDSGGQQVQQSQRQGPGGTNIIDLVIGQVASDIAGGGKVGQTIQSTYNVSRKGTRRG